MDYGEILVTGMAIILAAIQSWKWWAEQKAKEKDIYTELLPKMEEIYSVLNNLLLSTDALRVVVLCTENGGGVPRTGKPLYSSILYEVKKNHLSPDLKTTWQKQLVDEHYVSLLLEVHTKHQAILKTEEMPEGILKDLYVSEEVEGSLVFGITVANDRFYYLSLTYRKETELTPIIRNSVRVATAKLALALG